MADQELSDKELIVNYLPIEMTDQELTALCGGISGLQECHVRRSRETGASLGYGFLRFTTKEDAEKAADRLNGLLVMGKTLKVSHSRPRTSDYQLTNLYVRNIPAWTTKELAEYFGQFGELIDCKVLDRKDWSPAPNSTRAGFVRFVRRADAEAARESINGLKLEPGVYVSVEFQGDAQIFL